MDHPRDDCARLRAGIVSKLNQNSVQIRFGSSEELRHEFEKNISNRGIFIETESTFEVRAPIDVEIVLDYCAGADSDAASNVAITLRGEVVHCVPISMTAAGATPGVAIQFEDSARELCESFEPLLTAAAMGNPEFMPLGDAAAEPTSSGMDAALQHSQDPNSATSTNASSGSSLGDGATEAQPSTSRDRRGAHREAVRVPVRIMPAMSPPFEATSRDLSASGILLTVKTVPLPVGEVVRTCLWHPSGEPSIEIDGQVVREIKNKSGRIAAVAIAFDRHQAADPPTRDLIDEVRHAGHRSRLGGISGSIVDLGLANMLQMFDSSAPLGTIVVDRDGEQGWIAFAQGQFLHAELGAAAGPDALVAMLDWGEGLFHFEATVDEKIVANATPRSLEGVVFEAMCALDERGRSDEQDDGDEEDDVCVVGVSTMFRVDLEQAEILRSLLGKTEDAVLELAKSGMATAKLKEIIPESSDAIQEALESLVERGVLIPR